VKLGIERRPFESVAFSATQTANANNKSIELDTDAYQLGITLQITGTLTIGTASATAYGTYGLNAINLLSNIRLYGDGQTKYMENLELRNLARRQALFQGVTTYPDVLTALTAAAYTVNISVFVPFYPQNFPQFGQHPEKHKFGLPAFAHDRLTLKFDDTLGGSDYQGHWLVRQRRRPLGKAASGPIHRGLARHRFDGHRAKARPSWGLRIA